MTPTLRYPTTDRKCARCSSRVAMFNSELCGYCDEENPSIPRNRMECRNCKAPHGTWIQRSLTTPQSWIVAQNGTDEEPGYGQSRRSVVLDSGLCRWCSDKMRDV